MTIRNFTPHVIQFFNDGQFENLEQRNATTFVADGTTGVPLIEIQSEGMIRISTSTVSLGEVEGIQLVSTVYGDLSGLPDQISEDDILVVSLPTLSMAKNSGHPLASQMACPYQVVRDRQNMSSVLGAMGLSK